MGDVLQREKEGSRSISQGKNAYLTPGDANSKDWKLKQWQNCCRCRSLVRIKQPITNIYAEPGPSVIVLNSETAFYGNGRLFISLWSQRTAGKFHFPKINTRLWQSTQCKKKQKTAVVLLHIIFIYLHQIELDSLEGFFLQNIADITTNPLINM